MPSIEANTLLAAAVSACEDKKAEDIRILALDPAESGLSDYFLICSGNSDRQNVAITDAIEMKLKQEFGVYPTSVEGRRQGEWILMDYVDFIVHVFSAEKRAYYGLERLRKTATSLSVDELNAEIKAAITAQRPKSERTRAKPSIKKPLAKTTKVSIKSTEKRSKIDKSASSKKTSVKKAPSAAKASKRPKSNVK